MGTYKINPQPEDTPFVTMSGDFSMDDLDAILEEMRAIYSGLDLGWLEERSEDDDEPAMATCPDCEADIPNDGICWYCENKPEKKQLPAREEITNEPTG
jgi:hypothetical protein